MSVEKEQNPGLILGWLEKKLAAGNLPGSQQRKILFAADLLLNILVVVVLVVIIRTFVMSPFQVYGISMCNTLNFIDGECRDGYGDYIIINKSSYLHFGSWSAGLPQRGDVVVFRPPYHGNEFYIKRIIGLPGETIRLIDGKVFLFNDTFPDGIELNEPYLSADNQGNTFATGGISEFTVPEGKYLVLGDNRKRSSDSRLCFKESEASPNCGEKGATPYLGLSEIEGKAALVLWPTPMIIQTAQYPELQQ
jgi:signal peptidase I